MKNKRQSVQLEVKRSLAVLLFVCIVGGGRREWKPHFVGSE